MANSSASPPWRMAHSIVIRESTLYMIGGFDGKFFGGFTSVDIVLPDLEDDSCLASYCSRINTCQNCLSKSICSWCRSGGCTLSPSLVVARNLNVTLPEKCDVLVDDCLYDYGCSARTSCTTCMRNLVCAWCDSFSTCLPRNLTSAPLCISGSPLESCAKDQCDVFSTCSSCAGQSVADGTAICQWCPFSNTCGASSSSCSSTPILAPSSCLIPCSQITAQSPEAFLSLFQVEVPSQYYAFLC